MRRLALCFALLGLVACASEPDRAWVVQDAITAGDFKDSETLTLVGPDGGELPFTNGPRVGPPVPSELDLPAINEGPFSDVVLSENEDQTPIFIYDTFTFDEPELVSDEPDAIPQEAQTFNVMAEAPIDLEAPMVLSPRQGETLVRIDSAVSNAEVWTDGILLGPANMFLTLDPGSHELEIRANGFSSVTRKVNLSPQKHEIIRVDLIPLVH